MFKIFMNKVSSHRSCRMPTLLNMLRSRFVCCCLQLLRPPDTANVSENPARLAAPLLVPDDCTVDTASSAAASTTMLPTFSSRTDSHLRVYLQGALQGHNNIF